MSTLRVGFRAMASLHEAKIEYLDRARAERAIDAGIADVLRIEAKYSRYRDDSITSRINRAAGREPVELDEESAALLHYADRCFALSSGRFDVTSGVLRRAWDFRRSPPRVPDRNEIDALLPLIGWQKVEWDGRSIRLPREGMEIDFGGIGKEYAADRFATICRDHGEPHALVNLGGDVRAAGPRRDGSSWKVGIRDPRAPPQSPLAAVASIDLPEGAVATSGDYERYFEVDGRRYCHLLDPRSGRPVVHWRSISVVAPFCVVAGSCSTIAMLLEEEAPAFLAQQGVKWLGVRGDGTMHGNAGAPDEGRGGSVPG